MIVNNMSVFYALTIMLYVHYSDPPNNFVSNKTVLIFCH